MSAGTGVLGHRRAVVLLHPRSLPAGDFGPDAIRFLDFLVQAGMGVWQMLPLAPTPSDLSPYHCLSAHALSPEFLSVELLAGWGWGVSREMSRVEALRAAHTWFARAAPPDEHSAWGYVKLDLAKLPEFGKGKSCEYRGVAVQCGPRGLPGEGDLLFRNEGNGKFSEVGAAA